MSATVLLQIKELGLGGLTLMYNTHMSLPLLADASCISISCCASVSPKSTDSRLSASRVGIQGNFSHGIHGYVVRQWPLNTFHNVKRLQ